MDEERVDRTDQREREREPRQRKDKAMMLARRLGFECMEIVDVVGFSGGIWCFWKKKLKFEVLVKESQLIHGRFNKGTQAKGNGI